MYIDSCVFGCSREDVRDAVSNRQGDTAKATENGIHYILLAMSINHRSATKKVVSS